MRPANANLKLWRPLLSFDKSSILKTAQEMNIKYVVDPSNTNFKYERPKMRKAVDILKQEVHRFSYVDTLIQSQP
jgi:tRNA(Ile)-lysidine synthase TilS/MesJ